MVKIISCTDLQSWVKRQKKQERTVGFVPTMGYLHEGHLSLVKAAKETSDVVVVSIFVNPTQFGPNEDFERYPRDYDRDLMLLEKAGVDVVFLPSVSELYPEGFDTYVITETLSTKLEGKSRPGHFKGVCTVVLKLMNLVNPDYMHMGQKDIQQCIVLKRMIQDLHIQTKLIIEPTIRENDGLAKSSRNTYLSESERKEAIVLHQSLMFAKNCIDEKNYDVNSILEGMKKIINTAEKSKIDYIAITDIKHLEPITSVQFPFIISMAVYIGHTRLIDNMLFEE